MGSGWLPGQLWPEYGNTLSLSEDIAEKLLHWAFEAISSYVKLVERFEF